MQPQPKKVGIKSVTKKKTNPTRASAAAAQGSAQPDSSRERQAAESGAPASRPENLQAAIALRAYELYQKRGGQGGHELEDWLEAERQVIGR
jgi:hypothetical protein